MTYPSPIMAWQCFHLRRGWIHSLHSYRAYLDSVLSLLRSMRNYEAFRVYLVCLPACHWQHYKLVLATSFRIKAAVRSASRANRERLRSVNDYVERCACQSAHPIYKRRRRRVIHVYMRTCVCMCAYICKHRRRVHIHVRLA